MTTYTWTGASVPSNWNSSGDWRIGVDTVAGIPTVGDTAVVSGANLVLDFSLHDVNIVFRGQDFIDAHIAASNVDLGDHFVLTTESITGDSGFNTYQVLGTGTLDDGNRVDPTAQPGSMTFTAAPLTIDLGAGALFIDQGTMSGRSLQIAADNTAAPGTFQNDSSIDITGGFQLLAGTVLSGGGTVRLDGTTATADITGAVTSQIFQFVNVPENNTLYGILTVEDIDTFQGSVVMGKGNEVAIVGMNSTEQSYANGVLTFANGKTLRIAPSGSANAIQVNALGSETLVFAVQNAPCFAAGTHIATPDGETSVEDLRTGDMVRLAAGGADKIVWIGERLVRCKNHSRPHDVFPVRVRQDAFGAGLPARDLVLSPDHALLLDGVLIPVRYLINGATVVQEPWAAVTYYHVELARHDVILAEHLPAESFLDTGNRAAFANGGGAVQMHPDFARAVWQQSGCAPLVVAGPQLAEARRALAVQAQTLGFGLTGDPLLRVLADGRAVPVTTEGACWCVDLPPGTRQVRLRSRTWVPAHHDGPGEDTRALGVMVRRLILDGRPVSLGSPGLAAGWHAPEAGFRWSDGDGVLEVAGIRRIALVLGTGRYWAPPPARAATRTG